MTEPLLLTDLSEAAPGLRRLAHGYATSGAWRRLALRLFMVVRELASALPQDLRRALEPRRVAPIRLEAGVESETGARHVAIYVHYAGNGGVSEMVRCQLATLRRAGFAIVFVSSSPNFKEADWQAVRQVGALVAHRRNFGLDFGAWRDSIQEVRRRWPDLVELMLANDSVLGPIHDLAPVIEAMRSGGTGLFGLTESLQGGPHLQSYMLLARGSAATGDLMDFVEGLRISTSKWLLVQMGEVRLARWMRRRGHRVAAVFGYRRLVRAAIADPRERRRIAMSYRRLRSIETSSAEEAEALLHEWPLNPTHHLWHVLATEFGGPFLKTELVRRNPGRLPNVEAWASVVPPDSPCPVPLLEAHLEALGPG
jgi:Rhamnan synthesis protein F